jgi:DNA modification methylase
MWQKPHVEHLETRSSAEIAFTNIPGPAKHHRCRCDSNPQHPTQKPLGLMQWCIQQAGDVQTILDPWAGSGTTGHAAKNLGKRCVMIEREERYCEIAAARLAQDVLQFSPQNAIDHP